MSKKFHVFSTLANDQRYRVHKKGGGDLPTVAGEVYIKGGAGVANDRIITPAGVKTTINEDDYAILKQCDAFLDHHKAGYITVTEANADADDVADDMNDGDKSKQPRPEQFGPNSSTEKDGTKTEGTGNAPQRKK